MTVGYEDGDFPMVYESMKASNGGSVSSLD